MRRAPQGRSRGPSWHHGVEQSWVRVPAAGPPPPRSPQPFLQARSSPGPSRRAQSQPAGEAPEMPAEHLGCSSPLPVFGGES